MMKANFEEVEREINKNRRLRAVPEISTPINVKEDGAEKATAN